MIAAWKRAAGIAGAALMLAFVTIPLMIPFHSITAEADYWQVPEDSIIKQDAVSRGVIGRTMNLSFEIWNDSLDETWRDIKVEVLSNPLNSGVSGGEEQFATIFPFEKTGEKTVGGELASGGKRKVTIPSLRVRADLTEGYYMVRIRVSYRYSTLGEEAGGETSAEGDAAIYVYPHGAGESETTETEGEPKQVAFALGEGQETPYAIYPDVLDFYINLRNTGLSDALDVTLEMVLDKSSEVFPFEITDGSYDRYFEKITAGETVEVPYTMSVREDVYSGFYELKFNIYYRETPTGDLQKLEDSYWVRVKNKEVEEETTTTQTEPEPVGENVSVYARIITDGFETTPERIIAGEPFQLVLRMKNASSDISATNILLDLESEMSSESGGAVFTTTSGSSSMVISSLAPNETKEVVLEMQAAAGIDQRTYALKIKETYDSPDYKNAKAEVSINIPVWQIARLNTGTIEVMPEEITVGSETNVMFPINNTGKVLLYNVTVAFEADSIVPTDTYVGNIKPGESGNVDVMLTGAAGTTDDGKVKILITYEDEYGEVQEPVEKELTLFVTEIPEETFGEEMGMDPGIESEQPPEPPIAQQTLIILIAAAVVVALIIVAFVIVGVRKRKAKKRKFEESEGWDDEIS